MKTALALILLAVVMFARADNVYVASWNLGTIENFNSNGVSSSFAFNLNSPEQIAFDRAGNLFVANYGDNTVLKFATNGAATVFAGVAGGPNGLAFDGNGNLFVATFDGGTIEEFSPSGVHLGTFASGLTHPIGLAFDAATNLYVSTYDNVILKFTDGVQTVFAGGVNFPIGMAFDRDGNLYVANFGGNSITKFAANGTLLGDLATNGLDEPYFIGFDSNTNLYVANFGNSTVEKFTSTNLPTQFATISSPSSLAVWPGLSLVLTNSAPTNSAPFGLKLLPSAPGQMQLQFFGNTNSTFTVLTSTNLLLPKAGWTVLGTATLQSGNLFAFTDTHATNQTQFYAVRSP